MQKVIILMVAALAIGGGIWLGSSYTGKRPPQNLQAVTLLSKPYTLPVFSLLDENNQPLQREDLKGKWTIVFTGFTNCGHFCPMTMGNLRLIYDQLEKPAGVLFVSVDPERDSIQEIKEYVKSYDPAFGGATGTVEELTKFTTAIEAPWYIEKSADKYIVDHSSDIILIDPSGAYAGFIQQPLDIDLVAAELNQIL